MEKRPMEPVKLERVRSDATRIIVRVGLGEYELQGPRENILATESHVAWATVVHQLQAEGYLLVTPAEYAEETGIAGSDVKARLHTEGSLFGVAYGDSLVVPLPQKEAVLPDIEV